MADASRHRALHTCHTWLFTAAELGASSIMLWTCADCPAITAGAPAWPVSLRMTVRYIARGARRVRKCGRTS